MGDVWFGYTAALTTTLGIHAWIDAVCTIATLFPHLKWEASASLYGCLFKDGFTREVNVALSVWL